MVCPRLAAWAHWLCPLAGEKKLDSADPREAQASGAVRAPAAVWQAKGRARAKREPDAALIQMPMAESPRAPGPAEPATRLAALRRFQECRSAAEVFR